MNTFEQELQRVLNDNLGNRITQELGNGIYAVLMPLHNKEIEDLKKEDSKEE